MSESESGKTLLYVLIETLWNVNGRSSRTSGRTPVVLIETLWNVNHDAESTRKNWKYVLIETLWNVNPPLSTPQTPHRQRFNRNIVECK